MSFEKPERHSAPVETPRQNSWLDLTLTDMRGLKDSSDMGSSFLPSVSVGGREEACVGRLTDWTCNGRSVSGEAASVSGLLELKPLDGKPPLKPRRDDQHPTRDSL